MATLAYIKHRTDFRHPDDIGARADSRRVHLQRMRVIGVAGALVAVVGVASGWPVLGLSIYVVSLAPLSIISW